MIHFFKYFLQALQIGRKDYFIQERTNLLRYIRSCNDSVIVTSENWTQDRLRGLLKLNSSAKCSHVHYSSFVLDLILKTMIAIMPAIVNGMPSPRNS